MMKSNNAKIVVFLGSIFMLGGMGLLAEKPSTADIKYAGLQAGLKRDQMPRNGAMFYPGSAQIKYEGEYVLLKPSDEMPECLPLPDELNNNPFIEPIKIEPLVLNSPDGPALANGQGVLYSSAGHELCQGRWRNGFLHGEGTEFYNDGRVLYQGDYEQGLRQGRGCLYVLEGAQYYLKYEGEFYYQCFHGQGCLYDAAGSIIHAGLWCYGEAEQ